MLLNSGIDYIVLILVLMEDTLRDLNYWDIARNNDVLILVLMEDTLRVINGTTIPVGTLS